MSGSFSKADHAKNYLIFQAIKWRCVCMSSNEPLNRRGTFISGVLTFVPNIITIWCVCSEIVDLLNNNMYSFCPFQYIVYIQPVFFCQIWICKTLDMSIHMSSLKHKDGLGKYENLSIIFSPPILVFDDDYEGKSSSNNDLLWVSFIIF